MIKNILSIFTFMLLGLVCAQGQIRIVHLNPSGKTFTLKNFGATDIDIASLRMCHTFNYPTISTLNIVQGDLVLSENEEVLLSLPALADESDLGLYKASGSFGLAENMMDFIQFGSAGNGREGVANGKGIWTTGDFLGNDANVEWQFTGGVDDFGKSFWSIVTSTKTKIEELAIDIYPNPLTQGESISLVDMEAGSVLSVSAVNAQGHVYSLEATENAIDTKSLNKGLYVIEIIQRSGKRRKARLLVD